MTFAFSDVKNSSTFTAGLIEENGGIRCTIELFREPVNLLNTLFSILSAEMSCFSDFNLA